MPVLQAAGGAWGQRLPGERRDGGGGLRHGLLPVGGEGAPGTAGEHHALRFLHPHLQPGLAHLPGVRHHQGAHAHTRHHRVRRVTPEAPPGAQRHGHARGADGEPRSAGRQALLLPALPR